MSSMCYKFWSDLETYSNQESFKDPLKHLLSPEGDINIPDGLMKVCEMWCVRRSDR